MEFTKQQHEAISAAIREAEQRTCGQIICVLARSSSAYAHIPILWASALALITPWPLIDFTQWSVQRIFLVQLLVFLIAALIFSWMPVRLLLVPRALQRARAHRAALEQFVVRRVAHTKNRTGVLIFVSLAEHYAAHHSRRRHCGESAQFGMAGGNRRHDRATCGPETSWPGSRPPSSAVQMCSQRMPRPTDRPTSCQIGSTSCSGMVRVRSAADDHREMIAHPL